jgi:hypothetical protein
MPLLVHPPLGDFASDAALPNLGPALMPDVVERALADRLHIAGTSGPPRVGGIRVIAYKPGRRCLIEYDVRLRADDGSNVSLALLGKMRVNRYGNSGFRQLRALWDAGFGSDTADGISVPEPICTVPALSLWLQRKVEGDVASKILTRTPPAPFAARIARAVQKLHTCGVQPEKRHTMDDELRILDGTLPCVADDHPELARRISRLLGACGRLGGLVPERVPCGSHRDFYADQVLLTDDRMVLIDFDLFCEGDPGLDIGNFIGHVAEQSLREHGNAGALGALEQALEEAFVAEAGEDSRWPVRVYAALTLARHVYLSTRVANRGHLTEAVLTAAEERVAVTAADGGHA